MEYVDDMDSLELSDDESRAMKRMYSLCQNFMDEFDRLYDINGENNV